MIDLEQTRIYTQAKVVFVDPMGSIFRRQAAFLHEACAEQGKVSMLDLAAHETIHLPELAESVDQPLPQVNSRDARKLAYVLAHKFLHQELQRLPGYPG